MKILKRLRPHRPLLSVAVAILGVLGMVGGTLSFAGSASASTPGSVTPVFGPISDQPNAIDLLPGSPSAEGITAGATAEPAASWFFVTANNPAVSVLPSAINAPISNIVLTESTLDAVPALGAPIGTTGGFVCVTLSAGDGSFTTTATNPTFTVNTSNEGGTGTVTSTVFLADSSSGTYAYKTGTFTSPDSTDNTLVSQVLFPSTTTPTTYTFSGITVDAPDGYEGPVGATVMVGAAWDAATDECTGGLVLPEIGNENFQAGDGEIEIYAVGQATTGTRIAGSVADQTAEAALEAQWPPTPGGFCVPNNANPDPTADNVGSSVVLATDQNWPDALTGSYLASYYHTGVLLTPTASLSPYAEQAIQEEGISTVFIVGGPLAVSNGVQTTLEHTPQYQCGGSVPRVNALGTPIDLNVIRIDGPVADDTAEAIATYVDSGYVGLLNLAAHQPDQPLHPGVDRSVGPWDSTGDRSGWADRHRRQRERATSGREHFGSAHRRD